MKILESIGTVLVWTFVVVIGLPEIIIGGGLILILLGILFVGILAMLEIIFGIHIDIPSLPARYVPEDIFSWFFSFRY
jgi:hypothetical protein